MYCSNITHFPRIPQAENMNWSLLSNCRNIKSLAVPSRLLVTMKSSHLCSQIMSSCLPIASFPTSPCHGHPSPWLWCCITCLLDPELCWFFNTIPKINPELLWCRKYSANRFSINGYVEIREKPSVSIYFIILLGYKVGLPSLFVVLSDGHN